MGSSPCIFTLASCCHCSRFLSQRNASLQFSPLCLQGVPAIFPSMCICKTVHWYTFIVTSSILILFHFLSTLSSLVVQLQLPVWLWMLHARGAVAFLLGPCWFHYCHYFHRSNPIRMSRGPAGRAQCLRVLCVYEFMGVPQTDGLTLSSAAFPQIVKGSELLMSQLWYLVYKVQSSMATSCARVMVTTRWTQTYKCRSIASSQWSPS